MGRSMPCCEAGVKCEQVWRARLQLGVWDSCPRGMLVSVPCFNFYPAFLWSTHVCWGESVDLSTEVMQTFSCWVGWSCLCVLGKLPEGLRKFNSGQTGEELCLLLCLLLQYYILISWWSVLYWQIHCLGWAVEHWWFFGHLRCLTQCLESPEAQEKNNGRK